MRAIAAAVLSTLLFEGRRIYAELLGQDQLDHIRSMNHRATNAHLLAVCIRHPADGWTVGEGQSKGKAR